jgi:hypothetical protein
MGCCNSRIKKPNFYNDEEDENIHFTSSSNSNSNINKIKNNYVENEDDNFSIKKVIRKI